MRTAALQRREKRALDMTKLCQRARLRAMKISRTERPDAAKCRVGKPQVRSQ